MIDIVGNNRDLFSPFIHFINSSEIIISLYNQLESERDNYEK